MATTVGCGSVSTNRLIEIIAAAICVLAIVTLYYLAAIHELPFFYFFAGVVIILLVYAAMIAWTRAKKK